MWDPILHLPTIIGRILFSPVPTVKRIIVTVWYRVHLEHASVVNLYGTFWQMRDANFTVVLSAPRVVADPLVGGMIKTSEEDGVPD